MPGETLFVGLGSHHGDDRVGWLVADELRSFDSTDFDVRRALSPLDLLDWLEGVRRLGMCDACLGAGPGGTWCRWRWPQSELPLVRSSGSHDLGLVATLQLAERLGRLPAEVFVWGIELATGRPGGEISPHVAAAIPLVVRDVSTVMRAGTMDPALLVAVVGQAVPDRERLTRPCHVPARAGQSESGTA